MSPKVVYGAVRFGVAFILLAGSKLLAQETSLSNSRAADTARLRPGDVIRVTIWPATEFSQDVMVDASGSATFRRLGPINATGEVGELRSQLIAGYTRYVRNPSIEITFLRRVTVGGSVQKPGVYTVDPTMTLKDVIALAGGVSPQGDQRHVDVLKNGANRPTRYNMDSRIGDVGLGSGDQVSVPERSFVVRNSGIVAAMITAVTSLIVAFHR